MMMPMSRAWAVLGVFAATACLEPALVECPEDLLCPQGYICHPAHRTCLLPEQLDSCRGMPDDKSCLVAGATGYCRDEICLPISCGNGFVDLTEVCDDGNLQRGDGCNATCSSNETCGNGTLDASVGEECDDANLVDGDACDSRCRTETETWTVEGIGLAGDAPGQMVYDESRQQVLYVTDGTTWIYDGTRWSLVTIDGLPHTGWSWLQVTYDTHRQRVVLVGQLAAVGAAMVAYDWDGTAWTQLAPLSPPALPLARITYDTVRRAVLVVGGMGGINSWLFDPATGVLTPQGAVSTTFLSHDASLAFDRVRGIAFLAFSNNVFRWSGAAWTRTIITSQPQFSGFTILFDPREDALFAFGGDTSGPSPSVMRLAGAEWLPVASEVLPVPRVAPSVVWHSSRNARIVFGGTNGSVEQPDTFEWDGAAWTHVPSRDTPHRDASGGRLRFAYDPLRRALFQLGGRVEPGQMDAWILDANGWRQAKAAPFEEGTPDAIAYDPVRDGFVYSTKDAGTFVWRENWSVVEDEGTSLVNGLTAMTYDPTRRAIVGLIGSFAYMLESSARKWTPLPSAPALASFETLAFEARRQRLIAGIGQNVYELDSTQWSPILSPGPFFDSVTDARRGSVLFVRANAPLWELVDGVWFESANPVFGMSSNAVGSAIDGSLLVIVSLRAARLLWERTFVGPSPRDACTGGDDDGDTLVDCDDGDCWWSCTPACPPYASCP
jgi:cysteine-rich repeat protein